MRLMKYLLPLPFVIYGLVMGYLWLHVKNTADELIKTASAFATIKYDSIHTSLLGDEVGLDNIVISPNMTNDKFRIEKVRLSAPHIGYFLHADSSFKKGAVPEHLGMKLTRMHVDLNSEIFSMMQPVNSQNTAAPKNTPGAILGNIDSIGCGDGSKLKLADYRKMGVGKITADVDTTLSYNNATQRATVKLLIKTDNLYNVDMTALFNTMQGRLSPANASGSLSKVQVIYTDKGLHKLKNRYCASLNNSDVESYVNKHIRLVGEQLGVGLPKSFLLAYKDYMLNGGTLSASIDPISNLPMGRLQFYPPDEVISMLGLKVAANGTTLNNNQIRWLGKDNRKPPEKLSKKHVKAPTNRAPNRPKVNPSQDSIITYRPAPTYHKADVHRAEKHINRFVEVTLYNGRVRKGILDKVNEGQLFLELPMKSGALSFPVKISDVQKFRVRY